MYADGDDNTEDLSRIPKPYPASTRQLNYLCTLAERKGMDGEALASIHYRKDVADLTEDEAGTLITIISEG